MTPRSERYSYQGKVRVAVQLAPWQLVLCLDGINLSVSGLLAEGEPHRWPQRTRDEKEQILWWLKQGRTCRLQLEYDDTHAPSAHTPLGLPAFSSDLDAGFPLLDGKLCRITEVGGRLRLAFQFLQHAPESLHQLILRIETQSPAAHAPASAIFWQEHHAD